ncbi:MAG TPA: serine/threonine-protein kinase, partial [Myxococcota bacterium]
MVVTGRTLGRFRLEHELGSGGHGRVWSAVDTLLGDSVALKVLHPELVNEGDAKERLKREVVLARRVQHRGICRVNDLHEIDGTLVISMQLAPGVDLDALLEQQQLSVTRALRIIDRIADAVAAAHDEDVIHRDLKPSNIIVDDNDDIVVLDFGIASASDLGRLTEPGVVVGTLRFVAPEVLETARASARSDLYAIGVVGWALLAGRLPWGRPTSVMQLLNDLERGPPDLRAVNPAVPVAVANVILTAMSRDPDDRYADVKSFQRALALAASSLVSTSTPTAAASPAPRAQATQIVRSRNK